MIPLRKGPSGPVAQIPEGGQCAPLSIVVYVDNGTATTPADQDGSICAPYSTIQGAIDARASASVLRVVLTNEEYPEDVAVPASMKLALSCDWGAEDAGIAIVDSITASNTLLLLGVYAGAITTSASDCEGSGPVFGAEQFVFATPGGLRVAANFVETQTIFGESVRIDLHALISDGGTVREINSPGSEVSLRGITIQENIKTDGSIVRPANTLTVQDCSFWLADGGSVTTGGSQTYTRCRFDRAGSLTTVFGLGVSITLVDCEFAFPVAITCFDVQFDLYSWQRFVAAGGTVTGTVAIIGSLYQPAVPANWVGAPPTSVAEALDRIAAALGPIA